MNKNAIVTVSDFKNIDNIISLYGNILDVGTKDFDFYTIMPENEYNKLNEQQVDDIQNYGINFYKVKTLNGNPPPHWYKIYLFDNFFSKWEWVFYTDIDVFFFNPIDFSQFSNYDKRCIYTKQDKFSLLKHFKREKNTTSTQNKILHQIKNKFGDGKSFIACFLLFHNNLITKNDYFKELLHAYYYYELIYKLSRESWWEQSVLNIVFYNKWKTLGSNFTEYYPAFADYEWDYQSPYYDNTDYSDTICVHFTHYQYPWDSRNLRFYPYWLKYFQRYGKKQISKTLL